MKNVIYKIRNILNGNFYVGSTINSRKRFWEHRKFLRLGTHHCVYLQRAWNKYGEECFKFEIVQQVEDRDLLFMEEQKWLDISFGTEGCYNTSSDAVAPNRNISPEMRQLLSERTKAWLERDGHPRLGVKHTPETIAKLSENRKGKGAGEEHYRYGKTLSDEVKAKIGDAQRGKPKGPGRKVSPEGRAKIRANIEAGRSHMHWLGKKHTEESKLKMSKPVLAMPDNIVFPSCTATLEHYGLKMPTLTRALKTGKPISKGRLAGYSFSYVTSLTEPTK